MGATHQALGCDTGLMFFLNAINERNDLGLWCCLFLMIGFDSAYPDLNHIRETTAAAAALVHSVINLQRHNKLPGILIKKLDDGALNFFSRNKIAVTNDHEIVQTIYSIT